MNRKRTKGCSSPNKLASRITQKEGVSLLKTADLLGLGMMADRARKRMHPDGDVTFIIDRNINYTNVCINRCRFCAFYRDRGARDAYLLSRRSLFRKIRETLELGGTQILLQGGLHPDLDIDYYVELLEKIKSRFSIHVHGFSPPEIYYMADKAGIPLSAVIRRLQEAGLDSIPGGGAEILSDRIRKRLSPKKILKREWLRVMETAHQAGMKTTATMMFGSIEEPEDIVEHLEAIRKLQDRTGGFTAFIPWSFQPGNTEISSRLSFRGSPFYPATGVDYLRVLALSRAYLDNISNIQASWVTQGIKMAQVALRFGANDFGSTMLEENVVASAGVTYRVSIQDIIQAIKESRFKPVQRDMYYNTIKRIR